MTDTDRDAEWLLAYCQYHLDDLERARLRIIATRLTTQAAEIERLREALSEIQRLDTRYEVNVVSQDTGRDGPCGRIARAALQEKQDG